MQAVNIRQPPVYPPPVRTTALNAKVVKSRPILSRIPSNESIKHLVEVQSPEKTKAQALEECRQSNSFPQLACRYWKSRHEAEQQGEMWQRPENHIKCQ